MILSHLAAASLVVAVATGPLVEPSVSRLSIQQRDAATRVFMRSATECIVRTVAADNRFRKDDPAANLGDLIVDAMPSCLTSGARDDRRARPLFRRGLGRGVFHGRLPRSLPSAVIKAIQKGAD